MSDEDRYADRVQDRRGKKNWKGEERAEDGWQYGVTGGPTVTGGPNAAQAVL